MTAIAPDLIDLDRPHRAAAAQPVPVPGHPQPRLAQRRPAARNSGGDRLTNPPLALDLHYLLTAYGKTDMQADILLGYAMYLMHQRPWLDRATIRRR